VAVCRNFAIVSTGRLIASAWLSSLCIGP
jgi:hypothetical protein